MNLAEYALNNRALVKFLIAVLVVGGIFSFVSMSKLEDPEIKVKLAITLVFFFVVLKKKTLNVVWFFANLNQLLLTLNLRAKFIF